MSFDSSFFIGTRPNVRTSFNNCVRDKEAVKKLFPRCLKSQATPASRPGTASSRPRTATSRPRTADFNKTIRGICVENGPKNQNINTINIGDISNISERPHTMGGRRTVTSTRVAHRPVTTSTAQRPRTVPSTWQFTCPIKETHYPVLNMDKTKAVKGPIMARKIRSAHSMRNASIRALSSTSSQVAIIQPYPLNYNSFIVTSLSRQMKELYTVPQDFVVANKELESSSSLEEDKEEDGDEVDSTYWRIT